jgi:hypothetical protein
MGRGISGDTEHDVTWYSSSDLPAYRLSFDAKSLIREERMKDVKRHIYTKLDL